jgi:type II secretory pathway pseudopilin PulG
MVVVLGVTLSATGVIWHSAAQRDKERELLFIGEQFRQAIRSYYLQTAGSVKRFPLRLEDLVRDPRVAGMRRHLRQIYVDPMTGTKEWGLVKAPDGGIMGVFSQSEDQPIRVSFEHPLQQAFTDKTKYREWKFVYLPGYTSERLRPLP